MRTLVGRSNTMARHKRAIVLKLLGISLARDAHHKLHTFEDIRQTSASNKPRVVSRCPLSHHQGQEGQHRTVTSDYTPARPRHWIALLLRRCSRVSLHFSLFYRFCLFFFRKNPAFLRLSRTRRHQFVLASF